MPELDPFETRLARAVGAFADRANIAVDAAEVARVAAGPQIAAPGLRTSRGVSLVWVVVLVGLLLALVVGGLVAGGRWPNLAVVVEPTPVPSMTVATEATDILATTKAKPLPPQATCPPGSNPDALGPAGQDRPTSGAMAFDRHAGRIVLLAPDGRDTYGRAWQTWTYDVCTNTWQRMRSAAGPSDTGRVRLVYDADSDRTLAFTNIGDPAAGEIWSYDLAADRREKLGSFPWAANSESFGALFFHDPSGLVVAYDGTMMWAYDVDANTLSKVRQQPDPVRGLPQHNIALGYDAANDQVVAAVGWWETADGARRYPRGSEPPGTTWTFDPGTGAWRMEEAPAGAGPPCGPYSGAEACFATIHSRTVFDEASGLTIFMNGDGGGIFDVSAWDTGLRAWRVLSSERSADELSAEPTLPNWCVSAPPVYDPLNRRIVCLPNGDAVSAFSTATRGWRWLIEPATTPPPAPTLAPGATPIDWGTPAPGWPQPTAAPATEPPTPAPTQSAP